jgi:hypothetical protein
VSWLTLRSLFETTATSSRANAQMRREFDEMADRFQDTSSMTFMPSSLAFQD